MVKSMPLAAILVADLTGYSRRMKSDEAGTVALIGRAFDRARRCSHRFGGEVVKTTGDGWIALFDGVTAGVGCAVVLQRMMARSSDGASFRISVHLGEVRREWGDVFGHSVNVAVRMQALADPGGIVVSQNVVAELDRSQRYRFETIGQPLLKNIGDDVVLYRAHATARTEGGAGQADQLHLRVIGDVRLLPGAGRQIRLQSAHASALLGALALEPETGVAVDRLAVMFWPDKPLVRARANLARVRRMINAKLDPGGQNAEAVIAKGAVLSLGSAVETDLQALRRGLDEGAVAPVLRQHADLPGELLSGLGPVSPVFGAWLAVQRGVWRDRIIAGLEHCLDRHAPEQPVLGAAAEALLRLEPGHEPASMALMRHYAARGRKAAALAEFARLTRHLQTTFDASPSEAAAALAASLRGSGAAPAAPAAAPNQTRIPQIAMGAFDGEDDPGRVLAAQFRTELIANLARFRNWSVLDMADGSAGGADYAMTGRYGPTAAGSSLSLRLSDPRSHRIAWGGSFTLSPSTWRSQQHHVIGQIASALEIYISADRLSRLVPGVPTEPNDYDDWLRGEALLLQWSPEAEAEAEAILKRLVGRSPTHAPAHASLASICNVRHILRPGHARTPEDDMAGHFHASRAVAIDPMDARNQLALAWSAALARRFDQAAVHLDLAASLNPCSPSTMISVAMGHAFLGDHPRARSTLEEALALAPMLHPHQWCYVAAVRFLGGDPVGAEAAALRSGDQIVDNQGWLAVALARQGRRTEAQAAFGKLVGAVTPIWSGAGPCDAQAVHDWFVHAYPIRLPADQGAVASALLEARAPAISYPAIRHRLAR